MPGRFVALRATNAGLQGHTPPDLPALTFDELTTPEEDLATLSIRARAKGRIVRELPYIWPKAAHGDTKL